MLSKDVTQGCRGCRGCPGMDAGDAGDVRGWMPGMPGMSGDVKQGCRGCPGMSGDVRGCPGMPGMSGDVQDFTQMPEDSRGCPRMPRTGVEGRSPRFWSSFCFPWGDPGLRPQKGRNPGTRHEREKVQLFFDVPMNRPNHVLIYGSPDHLGGFAHVVVRQQGCQARAEL